MKHLTQCFRICGGACLTASLLLISASAAEMPEHEATFAASSEWVVFEGASGKPGSGKHIVLVAGDEEYRSEEALPMLAKILAQHHGFTTAVLFSQGEDGIIDPLNQNNIPGLSNLEKADLVMMSLRFRDLPDAQMKNIDAYLQRGGPVIGMRTSTHAFWIPVESTYAHYGNAYEGDNKAWHGGFGTVVLGDYWKNHYGSHGEESTRGVIAQGAENHPITFGIQDGDVWGPTDVYGVRPLPEGTQTIFTGQVLTGMQPTDAARPGREQPVAWTKTYQIPHGKEGRVFTTTMGAAQDFQAAGTRRMLVNAVYWILDMPVPEVGTNVDIVGEFAPSPFGFGIGEKVRAKELRPDDHQVSGEEFIDVSHEYIIRRLEAEKTTEADEKTFYDFGRNVYHAAGSCVTCHGMPKKAGFMPTALKFWQDDFSKENGHQPYEMYLTLRDGADNTGMAAQPQLNLEEKYAVIHYIREAYIASKNPEQYFQVTDAYLEGLPTERVNENEIALRLNPRKGTYFDMDFGPALQWTLRVDDGYSDDVLDQTIAQKTIAVRLDEGEGGIAKGETWTAFEHDLMSVSAFWSKSSESDERFVDWKGIAFDGSHGTHTRIVGDTHFYNPSAPGWANPATGDFADLRFVGRDGRRFGPLPKTWMHYQGLYKSDDKVLIQYSVGDATVYETHALEAPGVMSRTLNVSNSSQDMIMRVAPVFEMGVVLKGGSKASLSTKVIDEGGEEFFIVTIPANSGEQAFKVLIGRTKTAAVAAVSANAPNAMDLSAIQAGGATLWDEKITTPVATRDQEGGDNGYVVDTLTLPLNNPWKTWLRVGGFDFYEGGDKAAVATWNGDVWLVTGLLGDDQLQWQRIASGLFQPLGVKIVNGIIHVTCRDQIVRLHDVNGDDAIDWYENFNSDHQVTEHFHEFAMGLQTDEEGNFYYAKSARHAKTALVEHHGTLIKVEKDGSRSEIFANGFRAANGILVNDDGSFYVTDQQGHWIPENRINRVVQGGYYGNYYGYHDVTSTADDTMDDPLLWVSARLDRSPAELLWVKSNRWGPLEGSLLNISYGEGKVFVVPFGSVGETWQGAMVELPVPGFPTGIMRGRFSDEDGQLYVSGLFAWAGDAKKPGGFYRVRYVGTQNRLYMPKTWNIRKDGIEIEFTDKLGTRTIEDLANFQIELSDLHRSANYGSERLNVRRLEVINATLSNDDKTLFIELDGLEPAWVVEMQLTLYNPDSEKFERKIHGSIFELEN